MIVSPFYYSIGLKDKLSGILKTKSSTQSKKPSQCQVSLESSTSQPPKYRDEGLMRYFPSPDLFTIKCSLSNSIPSTQRDEAKLFEVLQYSLKGYRCGFTSQSDANKRPQWPNLLLTISFNSSDAALLGNPNSLCPIDLINLVHWIPPFFKANAWQYQIRHYTAVSHEYVKRNIVIFLLNQNLFCWRTFLR